MEDGAAGVKQSRRYMIVLDLEATCERDDSRWKNEVKEFPVVLLERRHQSGGGDEPLDAWRVVG